MDPRTLLSPLDIARLEERRLAASTAEVARTAMFLAGGAACYDAPGSWANAALGMGLEGEVSGESLDALIAFYEDRGAEARVEICPFVDPSLLRGLAERSFSLRAFENVLARPLLPGENLRASHPLGWPEGLEVVRVDPRDEATVRLAVEIASSGFLPEGIPVDEAELALGVRIASHPRVGTFLALWDGEPAGAGSVEVGGDVAALFGATVLAPFRRQGVQAALILARLALARDAGATLAVIHSHPGIPTERNALRLGFSVAYSKAVLGRARPTSTRPPCPP